MLKSRSLDKRLDSYDPNNKVIDLDSASVNAFVLLHVSVVESRGGLGDSG